jgi:hypothetical protein
LTVLSTLASAGAPQLGQKRMLVGTELLQFGHERIDDCDIVSFPFAGMENTLYREQLEERPISLCP